VSENNIMNVFSAESFVKPNIENNINHILQVLPTISDYNYYLIKSKILIKNSRTILPVVSPFLATLNAIDFNPIFTKQRELTDITPSPNLTNLKPITHQNLNNQDYNSSQLNVNTKSSKKKTIKRKSLGKKLLKHLPKQVLTLIELYNDILGYIKITENEKYQLYRVLNKHLITAKNNNIIN